jgi:hypothetical protein
LDGLKDGWRYITTDECGNNAGNDEPYSASKGEGAGGRVVGRGGIKDSSPKADAQKIEEKLDRQRKGYAGEYGSPRNLIQCGCGGWSDTKPAVAVQVSGVD